MADGKTLEFTCRCGELQGQIKDAGPAAFTHIVCHCNDCRAAYTHLGHDDPKSVGILQTTQDRVVFTKGGEHLRVFRHSPKGALRWFATCCDTPLFFTPLKGRLVHVGLNTDCLTDADAIGPHVAEAFIPKQNGKQGMKGMGTMLTRMVTRMAAKNISGEWRDTPFFDDNGAPSVSPKVLSREERAAALMGVRQT